MSAIWDLFGRTKKLPCRANGNGEDPAATNVGLATAKDATTWTKELNITPAADGDGTVTVYLKVTNRYAGDNYQIEMTKCVPGGCGVGPYPGNLSHRAVALSPIFTAWKRIHIERDKMFRKGGVLYRSCGPREPGCGEQSHPQCQFCGHDGYPACCGLGNELPCEQIEVYDWQNAQINDTIAIVDESAPYPEVGGEERVVMDVQPGSESFTKILTLEAALTQPYVASEVDGNTHQPTFANHHSAGYGVISGCDPSRNQLNASNSCFYQADLRGIEDPYNYVMVGAVESYCVPPALTMTGIQETVAHELAHQFFVNKGTTPSGHNERCQWIAIGVKKCDDPPGQCSSAPDACLMSDGRDRWDSTHRLDRFDLFCGDPGCPNGTTGCCESCALEGSGSIRKLQDPIPGGQP